MKKVDNILKILFDSGVLLIGFIVANVILSNILFLLGIHISVINFWASLLVVLMIFLVVGKNKDKVYLNKIASIGIFLVILFSSIFVASRIYDSSYDGNSYHKGAIGLMAHGWNPVYQTAEDFSDGLFKIRGAKIFTWIDHYQNLSWIFGASIYRVFGNIETAKSINYLLICGIFLILINYFKRLKFKYLQSVILSFVTVFSPVVLAQIFSFYIDGNLAIIFYLYIATISLLVIELVKTGKLSKELILILFASICILINLKLTGLLLAGVGILPFAIYLTILAIKKTVKTSNYLILVSAFMISILVAILLVGSTTYVKNALTMYNPFYPLLGDNRSDIITTMQPRELMDKNQFEKLLISIFSRSENTQYYSIKPLEFKLPLTWNDAELVNLNITDTRIGGFGLFFSFLFLLSLGILCYYLIEAYRKKQASELNPTLQRNIVLCVLAGIILYILLPTENWWARYAPNIYLLVPLALATLFIKINQAPNKNLLRVVATVCLLAIVLNQLPFVNFRMRGLKENRIAKSELDVAKEYMDVNPNTTVIINDYYMGVYFNLLDKKIIKEGTKFEFLKRAIDREALTKYKHNSFYGRVLY